jgi:hypothetical protein
VVFDHWADMRLISQWHPGLVTKEVALLTSEPVGVGTKFRANYKLTGEVTTEVVEYDRPRRFTIETPSSMGLLRLTVTCESVEDGTRLVAVGEGLFKGLFKLLGPLLKPIFRKQFESNLAALKRYLEQTASAS